MSLSTLLHRLSFLPCLLHSSESSDCLFVVFLFPLVSHCSKTGHPPPSPRVISTAIHGAWHHSVTLDQGRLPVPLPGTSVGVWLSPWGRGHEWHLTGAARFAAGNSLQCTAELSQRRAIWSRQCALAEKPWLSKTQASCRKQWQERGPGGVCLF